MAAVADGHSHRQGCSSAELLPAPGSELFMGLLHVYTAKFICQPFPAVHSSFITLGTVVIQVSMGLHFSQSLWGEVSEGVRPTSWHLLPSRAILWESTHRCVEQLRVYDTK